MTEPRLRLLYGAVVAGFFVTVAALRYDLALQALAATQRVAAGGGAGRLKVLGEAVLFGGILLFTLWIIPSRADARRDSLIVLLAAAAGFLAEAWGTRGGLWEYYTEERPPLWIVPAWPLGALVIDRLSASARERVGAAGGRLRRACYWALSAVVVVVFCLFLGRRLLEAPSLAYLGVVAGALFLAAEAQVDAWTLGIGALCVFFADFWGTTNSCWAYHTQESGGTAGLALGIAFGMTFDSALVLASLKAARFLRKG